LAVIGAMPLLTGCATRHDVQLTDQRLPVRMGQRSALETALVLDDAFTNATADTVMRRYQLGSALTHYAKHVASNCFAHVSVCPTLESSRPTADVILWPRLLTLKEQEPATFEIFRVSGRIMVVEVEWRFLKQSGRENLAVKRVGSRVSHYVTTTGAISADAFRELTLKTYDAFASIPELTIPNQ
jgi:hypothetical protein